MRSNRLAQRKGQGKREGLHRPSSPHHFDVALGGGHVQGRGPRAGVPGLWHGAPVQPAPCVVKQQLLLGPFGCFHIHTWEDEKGGIGGTPTLRPRKHRVARGLVPLL